MVNIIIYSFAGSVLLFLLALAVTLSVRDLYNFVCDKVLQR